MSEQIHIPVLVSEVLSLLRPRAGGRYLDATVGPGGHAEAILGAAGPGAVLVGLDRDAEALGHARARLARFGDRVLLRHARYEELAEVVGPDAQFDGILFDLGVSSLQFDEPARGFSLTREGPLDMRMDRSRGETAAELLQRLPERELADLIYRWGEERFARRIARAIHERGRRQPIRTTTALAEVVAAAVPRSRWPRHIHPGTRTFQALRITVNDELTGLAAALEASADHLAPGGRVAAISFHSLEDRIVKQTWRRLQSERGMRVVTRKPVGATDAEVAANPRARSAKLRALERPEGGD